MYQSKRSLSLASFCISLGLAGCAVGPNYQQPSVAVPAQFKQAQSEDGTWRPAQMSYPQANTAWWTAFGSNELNGLMDRLQSGNFTLQQYEASYRQASALVQQAQGSLFPTLGVNGGGSRAKSASSVTSSSFTAGLGLSWEPDFWGSVRRTIEADQAKADASQAQLAAMRLSLQSQLATAYVQLVVLDAQIAQTEQMVKGLQDFHRLTRNQYNAGTVASDVVANAQTTLSNQQSTLAARKLSRSQLEHAIAVLIGVPPAELNLPTQHETLQLPRIVAEVPSTVLQRRPDIAAAERAVAAANAQIGVAQAAYFPNITLSASKGVASTVLSSLFNAPQMVWSLGTTLAGTLLDGGQRAAGVAQARAAYDASVATYRQTVLTAFQAVEDQLATQQYLQEQAADSQTAVTAARKAEMVAINQYRAGINTYLNVITAQNSRIAAENTLWSILSNQYTAAVALNTALGGDWQNPFIKTEK